MEAMLGYMTESEKDFYLLERAHEIEMDRYNFLYESISRKADLEMEEAELKVMRESGDYEDLDTLYEASASEASSKKQGILSKMASAIVNFIQNILEKISSIFSSKQEDVIENNLKNLPNVQLDENPKSVLARLERKASNAWNKIRHPGIIKKNDDGSVSVDKKKAAVGGIFGAAVLFVSYKGLKKLMGDIKTKMDDIALDKIEKEYDQVSQTAGAGKNSVEGSMINDLKKSCQEMSDVAKEGSSFLQSWSKRLSSLANTAKNAVANEANGVINTAKDAAKGAKNKITSRVNTAGKNIVKNVADAAKEEIENGSTDESKHESTEAFGIDLGDEPFMESAEYEKDAEDILALMESV